MRDVLGTIQADQDAIIRAGSRGLEFHLVILVDPEAFGEGIEGAVDRYVAMTRATQQLVILTSS
jgi:DNA helicase IV